jgi:isoamylase
MEDGDWDGGSQTLGMYLNGNGIAGRDARGELITDDHFLLFFNVGDTLELTLPPAEYAEKWDVVIDTGGVADDGRTYAAGDVLELQYRSVVVLREHQEVEVEPDHSVAASLAAQVGNQVGGRP